ncbi:MAG: hypothetical protein EZS28_013430 [Streblomastix strix]|uniref:Uncharacterized protein n=1 Tax=Streblomastix strix TaxID=222440 RepID=A0A5J4W964_9EUKA|nr:MAG: hypothetical protein EZS28_013430 [Streblomastix strix]
MSIYVEQQEFSAICLFKDIYDNSSTVQVAVNGKLNMLDCQFQGTYVLDSNVNESSNEAPNEAESHIDEVIIKHEKQIAYNTFYIVDVGTCRICIFNLCFESKRLQERTQEVCRIPEPIIAADSKSLGFAAATYRAQVNFIGFNGCSQILRKWNVLFVKNINKTMQLTRKIDVGMSKTPPAAV